MARIDHLVWYCADLSAGVDFFKAELGCEAAYGGVHSGEGTRNSLLSLGEATYLEILARDPAQPESSLDAELRDLRGTGVYHWAAGGSDLRSVIGSARHSGLDAGELVTGGRDLPGGARITWQLAGLRNHRFGALVPFFIDWTGSPHPSSTAPRAGALERIEVFTPDTPALRRLYESIGLSGIKLTERAEPGMEVELIGEHGPKIIKSISPLPRGFVI